MGKMEKPATGGRPTRVSWMLLASYVVLLFVGGLGVWVSVINFGDEEASPPTPPSENITTTTTTTTPSSRHQYNYRNNHEVEVPEAYRVYMSETEDFVKLANDARLYLAPLCLVCLAVAGFTLVASLCSRKLFSSTFSLYSSLGLWLLTLMMTLMYQYSSGWRASPFFWHSACWVLSCQIVLLLFLPLQMLLCIWELWGQKTKDWLIPNLHSVFTGEAILLSLRLALTVFTFGALTNSQIFRGIRSESEPRYERYYGVPRVRYPLELSLVCFATACFNAVATLETTLSMLLGRLHQGMTTLTCLLSGLCCVSLAVLCSPVFVRLAIGPYSINSATMDWAVGLSMVTLLHWVARLFFPSALSTPPRILRQIVDRLVEVVSLSDLAAVIRTQGVKGMELLPKDVKHVRHIKAGSLIFSVVSLITIGVSAGNMPSYRIWGHIMVLCGNSITVIRTLPPLLNEYFAEETESIPVKQRLLGLSFETPALFLGGIVVCANAYGVAGIFGGVGNITFALFQALLMWCLFDKLQSQPSEETKQLTEEEDDNISQEEDKSHPADAMA